MNIELKKALKETYVILENSDDEVKNRIPRSFKEIMIENMDKTYNPNINFDNENWDEKLLDDTRGILAILYRDYLTTEEERLKIVSNQIKKNQNIDVDLEKNDSIISEDYKEKNYNEKGMIKQPWYKVLFLKIKAMMLKWF